MILLGKQWMEASKFIGIWGLCTSLVCVFGTFSREVYRAKGKPKISLFAQVLHLAFVVPVCLYAVSKGFGTLIYLRSFAFLQIILVHMIFIKVFFKMSPLKMFTMVKEILISSVIMGAFALTIQKYFSLGFIMQFVLILACVLLYFGTLFCFPAEREKLRAMLNKLKKGKS